MESKLKLKKKKVQGQLTEQFAEKILANKYRINGKPIGKGVSSTVMAGYHINTGKAVAIKKIQRFLENKHESLRILRQMILLRVLQHPNIVHLLEVIIQDEQCKELYFVLEYFPTDVKKIFKSNRQLNQNQIIQIIFQILCAIKYCYECQVLHRDLKPQNILVTQDLTEVKLCDFGLARAVVNQQFEIDKNSDKKNSYELSAHVTTRWYRAPELILLERKYDSAIDMWSVGCIFGELLSMLPQNSNSFMNRKALFPGKACYPLSPPKGQVNYQKVNNFPHSIYDQLSVIFDLLGTPDDFSFITEQRAKNYIKSFGKRQKQPFDKIYCYLPKYAQDFLQKSLIINPSKRMSMQDAIKHPLFDEIRQKFIDNIKIKGEPIHMDLQQLTIDEIKQLVIKQVNHYKNLKNDPINTQF